MKIAGDFHLGRLRWHWDVDTSLTGGSLALSGTSSRVLKLFFANTETALPCKPAWVQTKADYAESG